MAAHSKLGASSTHRWFACPGSVALIEQLGEAPEDKTSEFAARGTVAHALAAICLESGADTWEHAGYHMAVDGHHIMLDADDLAAVQAYLDAVRDGHDLKMFAGEVLIEHAFHCTDVHKDFFGTADLVTISKHRLDVWDYKHGIGVVVDVVENSQLLQYAAGAILSLALEDVTIPEKVVLHIAQPRAPHGEPIREWETTKTHVLEWVEKTWKAKAEATELFDAPLVSGEHCRFCPLKDALKCPELVAATERVKAERDKPTSAMPDWQIGALLADIEVSMIFRKALEGEAFKRLQAGKKIDGYKLADKRADRVWKDGATEVLVEKLGEAAYKPREIVSPAQAEKLPGGSDLVKTWAFKPDNGLTVARVKDARPGRTVTPAKEVYAGLLDGERKA